METISAWFMDLCVSVVWFCSNWNSVQFNLKENIRKEVLADNLYHVYTTEEETERQQGVSIIISSWDVGSENRRNVRVFNQKWNILKFNGIQHAYIYTMYIDFFAIHVNNNAYLPVSTGCLTLQFFNFISRGPTKAEELFKKFK